MDILLQEVGYSYAQDTPFEKRALHDVTLHIPSEAYTAIIGHTGSGKSTVLQHLNALLLPTEGHVTIGDRKLQAGVKAKNLRPVRRQVGIVFQFPEQQLFDETVLKDIMFGPLNYGVPEEEASRRAHELVEQLGLPPEVLSKSPFDLSGGQMRRVAIAGVLAMEPDVLVLDEPTAGLDPRGRREIMDLFHQLHIQKNLTTVLVTHSMEDAARYADLVAIMHNGRCVATGEPRDIFTDEEQLQDYRLEPPRSIRLQRKFEEKTGIVLDGISLTEEALAKNIALALSKGRDLG
ncbi:energy-coupling factor ABC transporter ATP-binding protein [Planomicrobium sp. CPCC 101110]|uniref:energy-coupling factor ABC transporter ATP-binding protein n=1 Tax=Planomicrobium sp. CPCC 101110 TaxID=2599619 RepID=UPI0011B5923A|nr:energy-coupling factor ABC transporter ATP-binding protein [Planomicrobium sp. CPCC 101110]TWT22953.1 energy-coupling factor ABC transporter ATP-binding protein [Planomicrobium sp. CPCC 101110]